MLRRLLIATALLSASGTALAHGGSGYGRVVAVEPHFVISFGTRHHAGFNVLYESAGSRYWMVTPRHPGHTIVLPPRHHVRPAYHPRDYGHGWGNRHGWSDRRDGWRDERREHHRDHREYRRHDRN
jgi:hypothetical protein